jgi:hypothetical protein
MRSATQVGYSWSSTHCRTRNDEPQEAKKPDASDLAECDSEAEEAAATTKPAERKKKRKLEDIYH